MAGVFSLAIQCSDWAKSRGHLLLSTFTEAWRNLSLVPWQDPMVGLRGRAVLMGYCWPTDRRNDIRKLIPVIYINFTTYMNFITCLLNGFCSLCIWNRCMPKMIQNFVIYRAGTSPIAIFGMSSLQQIALLMTWKTPATFPGPWPIPCVPYTFGTWGSNITSVFISAHWLQFFLCWSSFSSEVSGSFWNRKP